MRIAISGSIDGAHGETSRATLERPTAGLTLIPYEGDAVTLWILKIFDGDPSDRAIKSIHEYYREVTPPQSGSECLLEAEGILRSFYGSCAWIPDSSPLVGFNRSWSRKSR
jgi:hypothetical protein